MILSSYISDRSFILFISRLRMIMLVNLTALLRHKIEEQDRLLPPNYHELIAILEVNHLKIAADLELLKLEISLIVKR